MCFFFSEKLVYSRDEKIGTMPDIYLFAFLSHNKIDKIFAIF